MSYYDELAPGYDELHKEEQERKLDIVLEELAKMDVEGDILDVGCGTGFSLNTLAEAFPESRCVGVEPSSGMREQYKGEKELVAGEVEKLPFPDDRFGATVSLTAIQNFADVSRGVAEMVRVTRPRGSLIVTCLKRSRKLKEVSRELAEQAVVEDIIEEDKDLIFRCRAPEPCILNISSSEERP
ncbi:methyltransferase domain-containing protein [Candidatus Woesearchaeota archaeon]|nr:methyltransferase domain-containing protein [Candidatus Woesearchaeota archaeon]